MTGLLRGDALWLPFRDESVDLVVSSPPFWALRDYQDDGTSYSGQIGSEPTPSEFIDALLAVTAECARVLKPSGSIFVNLGDKYAGSGGHNNASIGGTGRGPSSYNKASGGVPAKSLMLLPERYRIGCVDRLGLVARAVVVWSKPNGLPESVTDRVRRSHEDWVHLTKRGTYYAAVDEIREAHNDAKGGPKPRDVNAAGYEPDNQAWRSGGKGFVTTHRDYNPLGKLPGSVWTVPTEPLQVPDWMLMSRPGQMDPPFIDTRAATAWSRSVGAHTDHPANPWPRGDRWLAQAPDHFAAFPTEWPRRLILGWSPSGVCTSCGEGRRPVVEKQYRSDGPRFTDRRSEALASQGYSGRGRGNQGGHGNATAEATITGYACDCAEPDAPTRPAVVLDPFAGTGTTVMVARSLGRMGVGVDLSADYLRLARWRTQDSGHGQKAERRTWDARQGGLFEGDAA